MAKKTIEEKHQIILKVLDNFKHVELSLDEACAMAGINAYQFQLWLEDKRLQRLKLRYKAVIEMRARLRSEKKVKLAERIIEKTIDGYEIESVNQIMKVSPEGKMIPVMMKRTKKQIGANINAALKLLQMYDKNPQIADKDDKDNINTYIIDEKIENLIQKEKKAIEKQKRKEQQELPPIIEIIEMPNDNNDKQEEEFQPKDKVTYIKLDDDTIIEI